MKEEAGGLCSPWKNKKEPFVYLLLDTFCAVENMRVGGGRGAQRLEFTTTPCLKKKKKLKKKTNSLCMLRRQGIGSETSECTASLQAH